MVAARPPCEEDVARVPPEQTTGRSLVTRRAIVDVVRHATLGSYGVTGFAGGPFARLLDRLDLSRPGLRVHLEDGLDLELDLDVALGVPVAEVARQVDSAIRYAVHRTLDLEVRRLVIHVDGLRVQPAGEPPAVVHVDPTAIRPRDLADSGTDVA
jgi:uncharacterized alkaline shock family protein YloU